MWGSMARAPGFAEGGGPPAGMRPACPWGSRRDPHDVPGSLGTMLVASVVNRNVPTAHVDDEVFSAARLLLQCRCGILPVVADDAHGARVVGLLRDRDAFAA